MLASAPFSNVEFPSSSWACGLTPRATWLVTGWLVERLLKPQLAQPTGIICPHGLCWYADNGSLLFQLLTLSCLMALWSLRQPLGYRLIGRRHGFGLLPTPWNLQPGMLLNLLMGLGLKDAPTLQTLDFRCSMVQKTRILQDRLCRVPRLASLEHSLTVKERALRSSVFPAMFHGMECQAFVFLYITFLFGTHGILDPEFFFVVRLLNAVRQFQWRLPSAAAVEFLHLAAAFRGSLQWSALSSCCACLHAWANWVANQCIRGHSCECLDFSQIVDFQPTQIEKNSYFSWQYQHVMQFTMKFSWYHFPDVSVRDTMEVLQQFLDSQRKLLTQVLAAEKHQLSTQKKHWLESETGQCQFCPAEDSRRNRFQSCPVGDQPGAEALVALHFRLELPSWSPTVLPLLRGLVDQQARPIFFTDGSCQYSTSVTARYAAFSVMLSLRHDLPERILVAERCRFQGSFAKYFQTIVTDVCPGEQDILRAELCALCNIVENCNWGQIHVDSQSALLLTRLVLRSRMPSAFQHKEHFGLLRRIWKRRTVVEFELVKVKAHVNIAQIQDPEQRFFAMGNSVADSIAETTRDKLYPSMVNEQVQLLQELEWDKQHLSAIFKLHLKLLATCDRQFLKYSAFGERLANMTLDWVLGLRWPEENDFVLQQQSAASWLELALRWMCFHTCYLPTLRTDSTDTMPLVNVSGTYSECGAVLQKMFSNLQALVPEVITPKVKRTKTSSIYHLGALGHSTSNACPRWCFWPIGPSSQQTGIGEEFLFARAIIQPHWQLGVQSFDSCQCHAQSAEELQGQRGLI